MTVERLAVEMRAAAQRCRARRIQKVALKIEDLEALLNALPVATDDRVGRELRAKLLPREAQLIRCMADGIMHSSDIARVTGTTVQVVKNYFRSVFLKTGMGSRLELLAFMHAHPEFVQPERIEMDPHVVMGPEMIDPEARNR